MAEVYKSLPATYLGQAVLQRQVVLSLDPAAADAAGHLDWAGLVAKLVTHLTDTVVEARPLLVTAALHPVGHLLANEVTSQVGDLELLEIRIG